MDNRFLKINKLLAAYSLGNFDKKLPISARMDEVDAFIVGVNMLGEELKEKTISRDYFNNIFNSVSDMVFVVDRTGKIEDVNNVVMNTLHHDMDFFKGKSIVSLFDKPQANWFEKMMKDVKASRETSYEVVLKTGDKNSIHALISASMFMGARKGGRRILMTAKDISFQKKTQNTILKAIIETEEKERIRFAKDIHDSLGQQLSAIKFYIGASANSVSDPKQKEILLKANAALLDIQADMRNVCFNIMPKSLEDFGLVRAVQELCSKNELFDQLKIDITAPADFPRLPVQQEFALFRIIQEFINNTLKHSKADTIRIKFGCKNKIVTIDPSDNGVGFNPEKLVKRGMGLSNVTSRIKPYNGDVSIFSAHGKGTRYEITIPLENKE